MKRTEFDEWLAREETPDLAPCPYCGQAQDERGGKIHMDAVTMRHQCKRVGWADLMPAELQYRETYAVACGGCGATGGHRQTAAGAAAAWNRRA